MAELSVEDTYQKLGDVEHILKRPDTFVGSCTNIPQVAPTFSFEHGLEFKEVPYVEGLQGIFDEIVVNAGDHKTRNPKSMTYLNVTIKDGVIVVKNNGPGIEVCIHKKYNEWLPEMLFGTLRTSSNFNDKSKKITGGRNGFGAKLTNVFSKRFKVSTTDAKTKKKFSMTWTDHMTKKSKPKITELTNPQPSTTFEFEPDMDLFKDIESLDQVQGTMAKRLLDISGTCPGIRVTLNNQRMPVRNFKEYCTYFANAMGVTSGVSYVRTNPRWEIGLCASPNEEAMDVSFVNHICTSSGGTHARTVRWILESEIRGRMEKKLKTKISTAKIRNNLCIFVNAIVENPSFGSQTKVELKTQSRDFGMRPNLDTKHFSKLFKESNIMHIVEERAKGGLGNKTPSTSKARVVHEKGLKDANWAGTKRSHKCRLILTEGDSAATLATSGREKAGGPDINGIYPLRGKLFNPCKGTKAAKLGTIAEKKELHAIVRILNLKNYTEVDYTQPDTMKTLRYGTLMIMVDQDKDGAHIGGLIMNFLKWWNPTILKVPKFLFQFITPVMKATKGKEVHSFFSEADYHTWKKETNSSNFKTKYYKGLGTSSAQEAKAYFSDMDTHLLEFQTLDQTSSDMLDVAFSGAKKQERKNWITQHGTALAVPDFVTQPRTYKGFLNSSLMEYNMATLTRAIPSMIDGFKEVQRKVLFACLTKNLVQEHKVSQVSSMVSEVATYHHAEASLMSTIVGMAQTFVGKNNINILVPCGQFGTRLQGGNDSASPRYIFTRLSPLARLLFCAQDDLVLDYLEDEGKTIEPRTYAPILPMSLVNGANGVATGWSTKLPMFNPEDVARYLLNDLKNQELDIELRPWYKGFTGTISKMGDNYQTKGVWEFGKNFKIRVTELPIGTWTEPYIEHMLAKKVDKSKFAQNVVMKHADNSSDLKVDIVFTVGPILYQKYSDDPDTLEADFDLTSTLHMNNIHLLDASGVTKKYTNVEQIMKEFMTYRLPLYQKRKDYMIKTMEESCQELTIKAIFINGVVDETIRVRNVTKDVTVDSMLAKGIPVFFHEALLSMRIGSLNLERVQALETQLSKTIKEKQTLEATTIKDMWIQDLEAFLVALRFENSSKSSKPSKRKAGSNSGGAKKK